ncbi:MAG: PAS domain S-box protein [Chloroflexi bacterium]|nr:PAS domain S-box protein [Chloroflexota bacterium]
MDNRNKTKRPPAPPGSKHRRRFKSRSSPTDIVASGLDRVLDSLCEQVIFQDVAHRIVRANKASADAAGLAPEELAGRYCFEALHGLKQPAPDCPVEKARRTGKPQTAEITGPDGRTWLIRGSPVLNADGNVAGFTETVTEITDRKRTEDGLRKSEEKYSCLVERSNDGIIIIQDGRLVFANARMVEMTGFPSEEVLGKPFPNLVAPQDRSAMADRYEGRIAGEAVADRYEAEIVSKKGENIPVEINARLIEHEGRPAVMAILRDMTEHRRMEEALKRLSIKYETLLQADPDIIMEVDTNKVYTWANKAGYEFFGDDVIGKEAADYFVGEQDTYDIVEPVFKGYYDVIYVESWQTRKDGEKRLLAWWCRELKGPSGEVRGALSAARDITQSKRTEEALRQSEEKYRTIVENATDLIFMIGRDGRVLSVNAAGARFLHKDPGEITGKTVFELFPAETVKRFAGKLNKVFETGLPMVEESGLAIGEDESWLRTSLSPVRNPANKVVAVIGVSRDITGPRRMEEALRRSEAGLRLAQATAKIGSWELDPLTGARFWSEEMFRLLGLDPDAGPSTGDEGLERLHPDDRGVREEVLARVLRGGGPETFELRTDPALGPARTFTGRVTAVRDPGGRVTRLAGTLQDITERKLAEEALRESEDRFRTLITASPDGISVTGANGLINYASPRVAQLFGYQDVSEIVGASPLDSVIPEDRERARLNIGKILRGDYIGHNQYRLLRKDGTWFWGEINSAVIKDDKANPTGFIAIIRDITERKRIEKALEESEERYRRLYDEAPVGYISVSRNGSLLQANGRACEMCGYSVDELAGRRILDLFPETPETRATADALARGLSAGREWRGESQLLRKGGSPVWADVSIRPIADAAGEVVGAFAVLTDVTERKRAEQALRASEQNFRSSLEGSPLGIRIVNAAGDTLYANQASLDIYGYDSLDELNATPVSRRYTPESYAAHVERSERRKRGEPVPASYEISIIRKDGGVRRLVASRTEIEWDGQPQFEVIYQDVTERRQAEAALKESEMLLEAILDVSNKAGEVLVFNQDVGGREAAIVFSNQALPRMTGYARDELQRMSLFDIIGEGDRDAVKERYRRRLRGETLPGSIQFSAKRKDGTSVPTEAVAGVTSYHGLPAVVAVWRDITGRKRAEEEMRESHRRLEAAQAQLLATQRQVIQQERLRALGLMASGIAHDFNNYLTGILGFSELLLVAPGIRDDKDESLRCLKQIHDAAGGAADVVRRLRQFYRPTDETEPFHPVHLDRLIEEVVSLSRPKWEGQSQEQGIQIQVKTETAPVCEVMGVEADLREAFINLLFNAVDAMPRGGVVTFCCRPADANLAVIISDTGAGMTPEVLDRCLEPFFTTKGEKGTGLGLSLVHGIVQRHGGKLTIDSKVGEGTTVTMYLPVAVAEVSQPVMDLAARQSLLLRVLVADDEEVVREVVSRFLLLDGHAPEAVSAGAEALRRLGTGKFDLLITDRAMPDMNGDELARAARALYPGLPVILLTGFGDKMNVMGEKVPGVDVVLAKPVTLEALREAIEQACG